MNRFKTQLIAAALLSVLAVIATIMNSHQAAAQGPPGSMAVNIVNPLPVPVSGAVTSTVTGSVGLASGTSVRVNNTVTDAVWVRTVTDGIEPFQAQGNCAHPGGSLNQCFATIFTPPAGKRAVIEYFSGSSQISSSTSNVLVVVPSLSTKTGQAARLDHFLPNVLAFNVLDLVAQSRAIWGQQVHLYADSGQAIVGQLQLNTSSGFRTPNFVASLTISGYLVDVPFTP